MKTSMKILAIALAIVLVLPIVSACGGRNNEVADLLNALSSIVPDSLDIGNSSESQSQSQSGNSNSEDTFEYGNGKDYVAKNLTGDYSITFRVFTSGSEDYNEITCMRTSNGYCISTFGTTVLYVKNGDKYDTYFDSDNGFYKIDFVEPKSEEEIQSELSLIYSLMTHYSDTSSLTKDGTETVAGRNCDRYKVGAAGFGVAIGATYCIDKATGVCLKYTLNMAEGGEIASLTFECTEFITSGVKLPAYN